jgi:hypothetical protein
MMKRIEGGNATKVSLLCEDSNDAGGRKGRGRGRRTVYIVLRTGWDNIS